MGQLYYCTRQRAGPLVKECRSLRPRLTPDDEPWERRDKQTIIRSQHSAVCRSQVDRLELRLALFGFEGTHYTLTFDDEHLPQRFQDVRRILRAFQGRLRRWHHNDPYDWIYAIEGKHGEHRWHIHMVLRYSDFSPTEVQYLWRQGFVDDEPVLLKQGGYRRLAEYLNKERTDGVYIPVGRHPWSCARSLTAKLPPPERWRDESGWIEIPGNALYVRHGRTENDFGVYCYGVYITRAHARVKLEI